MTTANCSMARPTSKSPRTMKEPMTPQRQEDLPLLRRKRKAVLYRRRMTWKRLRMTRSSPAFLLCGGTTRDGIACEVNKGHVGFVEQVSG